METPNIDPSMSVDQIMGLGSLPDESSKTPDKISESQLLSKVNKELYKSVTYDPNKDPEAKAGEAIKSKFYNKRLKEDESGIAVADQQQKWMAENRPGPAPLQVEAPKFADTAKSLSPLLMIMTQLAGGAMGVGANGMLGALKGKLDGAAQNNQDSFDRATDEWTKHWNTLSTNWKNKEAVYNQGLDWFKGQIDAKQKAAKLAEDAIGVGGELVSDAYARHTASRELMASIDGYVRAVKGGTERASAAQNGHWDKYQETLRVTAVAAKDFRSSALEMKEAWDELKKVVDTHPEIKAEITAGRLFGAAILTRLSEVDEAAVTKFTTAAGKNYPRQLKNAVAGMPARMAGLKITAEADSQAIPELKKGWLATDAAVSSAVNTATQAEQYAVDEFDKSTERRKFGQPMYVPMGHDSATQPTTEPTEQRPTNAPTDAKKAADGHWYSPDPQRPGKFVRWD